MIQLYLGEGLGGGGVGISTRTVGGFHLSSGTGTLFTDAVKVGGSVVGAAASVAVAGVDRPK